MSEQPFLQLKDVTKSYGENQVLKGISLNVYPGEIVTLIGPSGSGKTTALRCMNFLEAYDGGEIWIDGQLLGYSKSSNGQMIRDSERLIADVRRPLSMVFQQFNLWPHMTVLENVKAPLVFGQKIKSAQATEMAKAALQKVGLEQKHMSYPSQLSGGQQQRVGIARAVAVKPRLLLLDEPTSALDPELVEGVLQVILNLAKEGMTMVMVTHEMKFAKHVSSKVVFMEGGHVVEEGSPEQIFEHTKTDRLRQFLSPKRELIL